MKFIYCVSLLVFSLPVFAEGEYFVQTQYGPSWYQTDHNSNHMSWSFGLEAGYRFEKNINVVLGYLYNNKDASKGVSQRTGDESYQLIDYDSDYHALTIWVMPRVDWGRVSLSAGPGIGQLYDSIDVRVPSTGETSSRSGFEMNWSLRADIHYSFTDNLSLGFTWRQDYFEVDMNRDVADYEANQDRVYYLGTVSYSF